MKLGGRKTEKPRKRGHSWVEFQLSSGSAQSAVKQFWLLAVAGADLLCCVGVDFRTLFSFVVGSTKEIGHANCEIDGLRGTACPWLSLCTSAAEYLD